MMLEQLACYASIHSQARSIKILKTSRHSYQYMLLHIFILGRDITGGEPLFVTRSPGREGVVKLNHIFFIPSMIFCDVKKAGSRNLNSVDAI